MKLRRLTLHGFKSFADRTELRFHEGMTAIVGPNGCGKSNISDAVRWVLGEQRASAIRGSKMEEVIFQGTAERRAVNRAEVGLAFSNEDRRLPIPYGEVEVRRTVFREGGSEYELNRNPCRLKDIFDLYRDTGLGANAYTVIEQRMVDAILSDRAEERRHMFEEAAGIGRYKDRRRTAQRRLDAAQADLTRLEDLVAEVEAKVRSLARQRRRAQRYRELRSRRLALEVAVASIELGDASSTLETVGKRLAELAQEAPVARAALSAADSDLERLRLEAAEAGRVRNEVASRLEEAGRRIAERERELAVADERGAHAERRLAQIAAERQELRARIGAIEGERLELVAERSRHEERVRELSGELETVSGSQQELRRRLTEARRADESARARDEELSRGLAKLEADAAAAEARAQEAAARLDRLEQEEAELQAELSRLSEQGDLFAERARELAATRASLDDERLECAERLEALRVDETAAKQALVAAEDRASLAAAKLGALESLQREHHGFAPAVAAILGARAELPAVRGPVAEFLELPRERAALVEATLASLLQALVVDGADAADDVARWLERADPDTGALALIPDHALPRIEALLDVLRFVGSPPGEPVLLGRRERLEELRRDAAAAAAERETTAESRAQAGRGVAEAEARLRDIEARVQTVEIELRRADADEAARTGQRSRAERMHEGLERQRANLRSMADGAQRTADHARQERARLTEELADHRESWRRAADELVELQSAWDAVLEQESDVRVEHAQAEAALAAVERRLVAADDTLVQSRNRLDALDAEETEHRATLVQLEGLRTGAGDRLEVLFRSRDETLENLRQLDERLSASGDAVDRLEARVRELRQTVEAQAEERHRLELQQTELESAERRVRERLEAEWGRPFEQLLREAAAADGEGTAMRAELQVVSADLERLGPINMLAFEEHEEESRRLEFLTAQRDDLVRARDDLQSAIRQINKTARQLFGETLERIRGNFQRTFQALFEGGECDLWLADPEDPLESAIEISASPRGKRTQRIHLLSGGERALTALALLFAIYLVKPSPFCVLDEVDAPLDEANIGRFLAMLEQFKADTQFIVITHNPRTMGAADWIYGVTMEEPGVSRVVGVHLEDVVSRARAAS